MTHILVSNDDGYKTSGLQALVAELSQISDVTVVAPLENRSASSSSLSVDKLIRVTKVDKSTFSVDGTPADCVHIALTALLGIEPDIVVSGINNGANLGDDIIYSGTVGAAIEGRFLKNPAIAVSIAGDNPIDYAPAAKLAASLVKILRSMSISSKFILNVNVPNLKKEDIRGILITKLGVREKPMPAVLDSQNGRDFFYKIGAAGDAQTTYDDTDFNAIASGFVSVTPIHFNYELSAEPNSAKSDELLELNKKIKDMVL
jgi:5'-nucleotidase